MKYYKINRLGIDKTIALVFHDYASSYQFVRSTSEAFSSAFDGVKNALDYKLLVKENDQLVYRNFGVDNPIWCETVLKRVCSDYWEVIEAVEIDSHVQVDEIIQSILY